MIWKTIRNHLNNIQAAFSVDLKDINDCLALDRVIFRKGMPGAENIKAPTIIGEIHVNGGVNTRNGLDFDKA